MAIVRFTRDFLEFFDLEIHNNRSFSSGSTPAAHSGSLRIFPRASTIQKESNVETVFAAFQDGVLSGNPQSGQITGRTWTQLLKLTPSEKEQVAAGEQINLYNKFSTFNPPGTLPAEKGALGAINRVTETSKLTKFIDIKRFKPTTDTRHATMVSRTSTHPEFEPTTAEKAYQPQSGGDVGISRINKASKTFAKKSAFINTLPSYRMTHPDSRYGFTNYTCINFFTGGMVPSDSVIMYPNIHLDGPNTINPNFSSGCYMVHNDFSFDFYINPRYNFEKAGTLFHLSSTYALSLITGSAKNNKAEASGFKMLLQLSHSADIPPSEAINNGTYPYDLIFTSSNNSLSRNHWHHVCVRWGQNTDNSTGSFTIDGSQKGLFVIPSSSISPPSEKVGTMKTGNPNCLYVGNYYEGSNLGQNSTDGFFNADQSFYQGTINMDGSTFNGFVGEAPNNLDPTVYSFTHPLNAECHDLKIYNRFISDDECSSNRTQGVDLKAPNLLFYVPPFFTCDGPTKRSYTGMGYNQQTYLGEGGIMMSPAQDTRRLISHMNTAHPYNIWRSLECEGLEMNLENFVRDFRRNLQPRLQHLTSSYIRMVGNTDLTDDKAPQNLPWTSNELTYAAQKSVVKKNLSVLPCDNGKFIPNFNILDRSSFKVSTSSLLFNGDNYKNLEFIDLTKPMFTGTVRFVQSQGGGGGVPGKNFVTQFVGFRRDLAVSKNTNWYNHPAATKMDIWTPAPENPSGVLPVVERSFLQAIPPTNIRPMNLQRMCDTSSNEVVFFEISDLFYGTRIKEGTLTVTDTMITGSSPDNKIKITVRDNEYGGLYRADAATKHATWNIMGSVLYNEGLVAVTFPSLSLFGKEQFNMSFEGVNTIYVAKYNIPALSNTINSSSNSSYKILEAQEQYNSGSKHFMITNINLHDDDFNIIGRINLAQPVFKRPEDKLLFKPKMDF